MPLPLHPISLPNYITLFSHFPVSVTCTLLSPLYCCCLYHNGLSSLREQFLGGSEDCPVSALCCSAHAWLGTLAEKGEQ